MEKNYTNQRPELLSNSQSLIQRNQELLGTLCFFLLLQIPILINFKNGFYEMKETIYYKLIYGLYIFILLLMIYGIIKLIIQIKISLTK